MPKIPTIEKSNTPSKDWDARPIIDISDTVTYGTYEESIESIERLLRKGKKSMQEIIDETGDTKDNVINAVSRMADKGMIAMSIKTTPDQYIGQLRLDL
jgi:predicted transcriptional regulator